MSLDLGSFSVTAEPAEVAAFREATGLPAVAREAALPLTYPMRWLVTPSIRAALIAMVPEPDLVLVHESQSFEYQRSLHAGDSYMMSLTARRETSPDRLLVDGTIADAAGTICVRVETILRLFSTEVAAA